MKFKDQGSVFDFARSLRRTCKLSLGVAATIAAAALAFALARSRLAGGVAGDATPGLRASQAYEFMHEAAADEALTEPGSPRASHRSAAGADPGATPHRRQRARGAQRAGRGGGALRLTRPSTLFPAFLPEGRAIQPRAPPLGRRGCAAARDRCRRG